MRLFIGFPIPGVQRQRLEMLQSGLKGARWIDPENFHATLRFIGEADGIEAKALHLALQAVEAPPFEVLIADLGTFGRPPKSLWAGVRSAPADALGHLAQIIESAVVRAGFQPERRKFSPHVTLARLRGVSAAKLAPYLETSGGGVVDTPQIEAFGLDAFALYKSHLSHKGAHYQALETYPLEG